MMTYSQVTWWVKQTPHHIYRQRLRRICYPLEIVNLFRISLRRDPVNYKPSASPNLTTMSTIIIIIIIIIIYYYCMCLSSGRSNCDHHKCK